MSRCAAPDLRLYSGAMNRALRSSLAAPLLAVALLAGACHSATTTGETYCTTLDQYRVGLQSLADLDPATADQGQYVTEWDNVLTTYNQLTAIQEDAGQAEQRAFQEAHQNLDAAVKALPSSATGQEAHDALQPLIQKVSDAEKALSAAACPNAS
jgi:Cu/Ag efflux pump CusA